VTKFILVFAIVAAFAGTAHAHTSENVLFTCEGELIKYQGINDGKTYYDIVESWKDEGRTHCYIDEGQPLKQVLAVCRVGDFCTVAAKGESGNGPAYVIQKVFEVQRQPASRVQELQREFKQ
jgi:hypothetical protein